MGKLSLRYLGLLILFMAALPQAVYASWDRLPMPQVVTLNLGPTWSRNAQKQSIYLLPEILNTYVEPGQTDTLFEGELFVGWQGLLDAPTASWQLGLAYFRTTSIKLRGTVWQLGEPQFDNQVYSYKINHQHVAVKGKLLQSPEKPIQLYVSGSLGVGFNNAHGLVLSQLPH